MITNPAELHDPTGFGYSHVASVGDLVFVAGQYASGPDGHVPVEGFAEQVELSFDNLGVALRSAGLDYAEVFQLRTYIVDHSPEKLAVVGAAIARRWPRKPPVQTLLGVACLALPDMSFEVDAIAVRPLGCTGERGWRHTDWMALTDEAIVKIKGMITSGELGPGDRLPKEADLAARLGLSRNSLREAVKALTLVNVLDVRHGDGTYVTSLDSAHLLDALNFMVDLHRDDSVLQFFEVRRLLEPGVAALAAVRINKEQLTELRLLCSDLTPDAPVEELVANDLRFHRAIAEATGNQVVCSLLDGISGATQRARIWRGVTQAGAVERTLSEHAAILDAIEIGDAEAARAWMTAHIAGVETWLRKAP